MKKLFIGEPNGQNDWDYVYQALRHIKEASFRSDGTLMEDVEDAATGRKTLGIDKMTKVGDTNYTILPTDSFVGGDNTAFTAPRTWTLPLANSVNAGKTIVVLATSNSISAVNTLTVATSGADIFVPSTGTTITTGVAGDRFEFVSNGVNRWSFRVLGIEQGGTGAVTASAARANLSAASAAAGAQTAAISFVFKNPTNDTIDLVEAMPFGATITGFSARTDAGTITTALKINGAAVTGGAINATSTRQTVTPSGANTMVANDVLQVTNSSVSGVTYLFLTVKYTFTLAV